MNKPTLLFSGPVSTRSGYGDHSRDLVLSLIKMDKFDVKIMSTRWGSTPMNQLNPENPDHVLILERILTQQIPQPDVFVQVTVPNEFVPAGKYNIGITAGIETTAIPVSWVEGCNKMDLLIVPSEHAKKSILDTSYQQRNTQTNQVIAEHRVTKPIEVLFEGSNTDIYKITNKKDDQVEQELEKVEEDFNFLFVGHWLAGNIGHDRKDVGMMIKTFLTVFKDKKNRPGLILKTSQATFSVIDREEILKRIRNIKESMTGDLPNIYLIHGDLNEKQMNCLYNHDKVKAMISFTKGEGYGRPLQEFSFTGKPIIASNWSGHVDFLKGYNAELIGGSLNNVHESAANDMIIKESKWFTVDYNIGAQVLDHMFNNYNKYLQKGSGQKQSAKFSLSKMDSEFEKIVEKYVKTQSEVVLNLPTMGLPTLSEL